MPFRLVLLITLICTVMLTPVAAREHPVTAGDLSQAGPDDSEALASAIAPPRDRISLAQRLLGVGEIAPPPTSPQKTYQVGDTEEFFVQNVDEGAFTITARLVYSNPVVYVWVEDGYTLDQRAVEASADKFAADVYEPVRRVFGSEASPGIDGDPRLHILHAANLGNGIAAYYYSESQLPSEAVSTSNQREMFFVNLDTMRRSVGTGYYTGVLAHEFQHMIHWAIDANEESWLNEGLSELATYIAGLGRSGFATAYLENPNVQLTYWPQSRRSIVYGGGFLFTAYLLDRFGIDAVRELVASPANGMDGVEAALQAISAADPISGQALSPELLFMDFAVANLLNDPSVADGQFSYDMLDSLSSAALTQEYAFWGDFDLTDTKVDQWSTQYYSVGGLTPGETYTLAFEGNETGALLPVSPYSGQFAYWSNRVDDSDTRLTLSVDLTEVENATLSFWTWYDIEENWDNAYVMVSTDAGATWQTLASERTTTANPFNTSYGNAYTGQSGEWVQEEHDLSAFAGQTIQLRWEYITDDATIENGFLLDDVAIPEIGFFADFEAEASEWQSEGWVRIQNIIRQDFGVQIVHMSDTPSVERLLLPGEGTSGEWTFTAQAEEIIIAVSPFAPMTTEPAIINMQFVE